MHKKRKTEWSAPVRELLLQDRTTGGRIVWGTDDYASQGPDFAPEREMTARAWDVLRPRAQKAEEQRARRTRTRAEVFTPAWICKAQLDLADEPGKERSWQEYADAPRLEVACGEAPYLTGGRDAVTGRAVPLAKREGVLDRKLRAVSAGAQDEEQWLRWALRALKSVYGFELQGDSLLLARENLLRTFCDALEERLGRAPAEEEVTVAAEILCWNLWQMDASAACPPFRPDAPCRIKNWRTGRMTAYRALLEGGEDLVFDAVVGNPPYQRKDGGNGASATPVYPLFVQQAKQLNPVCASLIIPAKWYSGGKGLDRFRDEMLHDRRISHLVDYTNSLDCFPGVDIAGGACYFLWQRDYSGPCRFVNIRKGVRQQADRFLDEFPTLIRYPAAVSILHKVRALGEPSLAGQVSSRKPFGLATNVRPASQGELTLRFNGGTGPFPREQIHKGQDMIDRWKVMLSYLTAEHAGQPDKSGRFRVLSTMELLGPGSVCTETYLVAGSFAGKRQAMHLEQYLRTRFVRFLIGQVAVSQHVTRQCFAFVPQQDFSKSWTDRALYEKYGLTREETDFIQSLIKPMDGKER